MGVPKCLQYEKYIKLGFKYEDTFIDDHYNQISQSAERNLKKLGKYFSCKKEFSAFILVYIKKSFHTFCGKSYL